MTTVSISIINNWCASFQSRGVGARLPQGASPLEARRSRALGARRCLHDHLRHRHSLLPLRRPVMPDPVRGMGLLQFPDEHHELVGGSTDSRLPVEWRVGHLSDEGPVEGERTPMLSQHEVECETDHTCTCI